MTQPKAKTPTITLDAAQTPDATVLVHDKDGRILMSIADAITSCAMGQRMLGSVREELAHIVEALQDWAQKNANLLKTCHVSVEPGKVFILCAPQNDSYDFELGDKLAALTMELTNCFRLFAFDSLQCPTQGFAGFVPVPGAAQLHAH